jgi:sporulation protein YlmC with PRC-barrel domain
MKNIVCLAFIAGSLLAGPAFAEDKSTSHPDAQAKPMAAPPAGTAMPTATDGAGGMTMANTATVKIRFITAKPADIMSSKLVGKTLYNNKNENVGEIEDLVIDNGKTVTGVVVSVGGFLGLGERYVLVDPATIFLHQADGSIKAIVDTDKDTLKNAPAFKYNKKNT